MTWRLFPRPSTFRHASKRRVLPFPRLGSEMLEERVVPTTTRFAVGVVENSAAHVRLYDATGVQLADIDVSALAGTGGQPSFATADVTGDGTDDLIVGSGVGVASKVQV